MKPADGEIMRENGTARLYDASDIEAATGGRVNPLVLRSWILRELFVTELLETVPGRARMYLLEHVHEAVMLSAFSRTGVQLERARLWIGEHFKRQKRKIDRPLIAWEAKGEGT